jgi:hypothetical protein
LTAIERAGPESAEIDLDLPPGKGQPTPTNGFAFTPLRNGRS